MTELDLFKEIVLKDKIVDTKDAISILIPILKKIPAPVTTAKVNSFIERAVVVKQNDTEITVSRLSYLPQNLKDKAKEGRFNREREPAFYGSFTDLNNPELTRYFLSCEVEQNIFKEDTLEFEFIASKWISIKSFDAILFIFDEKYCENKLLKIAFDNFQKNSEYNQLSADEKEILKLITQELAKPNPKNGYAISNTIFDFYKSKGFKSIIYPSVQSNYRSNNIAITPELFDKSYSFYMAVKFKFVKNGENIEIDDLCGYKIESGKLSSFVFDVDDKSNSESFPI